METLHSLHKSWDRIPLTARRSLRNAVIAGVAMAFVSLFMHNSYSSQGRILPVESRPGAGNQMAMAAAAAGLGMPGQEGSDSFYVDILTSRWMAKRILNENYNYSNKGWYFGKEIQTKGTLFNHFKAKNMDQAVRMFNEIFKVHRDLKTKLLTISVETTSPQLSQQIIQNSIRFLGEFLGTKGRTRGGNKAAFISERLQDAKKEFEKENLEAQNFFGTHRNYLISNDPDIRFKGAMLETSVRLRQQVITTLTLAYEQALMEEKDDVPILNVLDGGDLPLEKTGPPRLMYVLLLMLFVGCGVPFLLYLRNLGGIEIFKGFEGSGKGEAEQDRNV